jgi:hypothetical protein
MALIVRTFRYQQEREFLRPIGDYGFCIDDGVALFIRIENALVAPLEVEA